MISFFIIPFIKRWDDNSKPGGINPKMMKIMKLKTWYAGV